MDTEFKKKAGYDTRSLIQFNEQLEEGIRKPVRKWSKDEVAEILE